MSREERACLVEGGDELVAQRTATQRPNTELLRQSAFEGMPSDGRFKRLPIEDVQELSGRATSVLKLKDGVTLQRVVLCRDDEELVPLHA